MSGSPPSPSDLLSPPRSTLAQAWYGFVDWYAASRSHRVVILVLAIWVINSFDLMLTLLSHQQGMLDEENPLANYFLKQGIASLVLYKAGMVLIGSYSLLRFRHTRIAEMGAFIVVMVYALLAVRWQACSELYTLTYNANVHTGEIEAVRTFSGR